MKWLAKIAVTIVLNAAALWLAAHYIDGFVLGGTIGNIIVVAIVLIVLNTILKPILKLIFSPFIILTLGLATLIVNALILYILDFLSKDLTIGNIRALILATLLLSAVNFVSHAIHKE